MIELVIIGAWVALTISLPVSAIRVRRAKQQMMASRRELNNLRKGIKECLTENCHLADGEICTLAGLKKLVPEWEAEFGGEE